MHRDYFVGAAAGFAAILIGSASAMATPCTNLQTLALEQTTITSATDIPGGVFTVPETGQKFTGLPAFCRVTATIAPSVDSAIKIEVWLPETTWSGRFLGLGSGGYGAYIDYNALALRLNAGYAVANTGLGTGVAGCNSTYCGSAGSMGNPLAIAYGDPPNPTVGLFGSPERIKDYGYRAIHLMTLRGKEITTAFYQRSADKSYFFGCSTGGQNALMEAQRFPHDYDGIVAGAAAFNHTRNWASGVNGWRRLHDRPGSFIQTGQMTLINKAVIKQCVGQDGGAATDQFLTDPRDCHFDPGALQCTGGDVPPACLTADQVTAIRGYYAGLVDPVTGERILPGAVRGSETDDVSQQGLAFLERLPEPSPDGAWYWVFGPSFGQPGSAVNYLNFDVHRDLPPVDDNLAETVNATSTDLREFREHGGKLIMYHGWADAVVTPLASINYFNALVAHDRRHFESPRRDHDIEDVRFDDRGRPSPLRRTQSYARLFMVPGMYHCGRGGPGPNTFGALAALLSWVENGTVPETILATKYVNDTPPVVQMTRPLCVFPKVAKYNGSGSTDDAANFTCVTDERDSNQEPARRYGP